VRQVRLEMGKTDAGRGFFRGRGVHGNVRPPRARSSPIDGGGESCRLVAWSAARCGVEDVRAPLPRATAQFPPPISPNPSSKIRSQGVRGYPTLQLYKGGSGSVPTPIKYSGARELAALKDFVAQHTA
jgi:hypothetical protein